MLLRTASHCTVYMPIKKRNSHVATPAAQSAPSLMQQKKKTPVSLYNLLGVGTTMEWPKTDLDKLLQAMCARFAVVQKDGRRKHWTSLHGTYP